MVSDGKLEVTYRMRSDGQVDTNDNAERPAGPGGHSRRKQDLTGRKHGCLTVTGPAENVCGNTAWRCRCDCGRETVATTGHLRSGHTTSCGCAKTAGRPLAAHGPVCVDRTRRSRKNSASGVTGVYWDGTRKRWTAHIYFRRERLVLGRFEDFNEAVAARRNAEEAVYRFVLDEVYDGLDQDS